MTHATLDRTRVAREVFIKALPRTLETADLRACSQSIAPFCEARKPQQARFH